MSRSVRLRTLAVAVALVVGVTSACASGSSADDAAGPDAPPLTVDARADGFVVAWHPDRGVPDDPEIEVMAQTALDEGWRDETAWTRLDLDDADGDTIRYDDVEVDTRYRFRVRTEDGAWSEPIDRIHVATDLPVIRIDTDDPTPTFAADKEYNDAHFTLDPAGADGDAIDVDMRVRARGNSTWESVPGKKSFQVDFEEKTSVLGLPESKKLILLANYLDPSQIRNWTAMAISRATDLAWTPQSTWVELYLNGDYFGLYEAFEKVDTGKNKIDIDEPGPQVTRGDALTGGYLLQIAWGARPDKNGWITPHQVKIHVQRPQKKDSNDDQLAYIRDFVNTFEAALFADDFTDPDTGYRRYLDVDSFIDLWIVQETTVNTDAYSDSLYFYKKRGDDKLYFGPAWDFDTSLGTRLSLYAETTKPWFTTRAPPGSESTSDEEYVGERHWVMRVFQDPWFRARVAERWNVALPEIEKIPDELLEVAASLEPAKANDRLRWKDTVDTVVGEHRFGDAEPVDDPEFIADWLRTRIAFITEHVESSIDDYPVD